MRLTNKKYDFFKNHMIIGKRYLHYYSLRQGKERDRKLTGMN